jgi:hypothetical protein
MAWWYEIRGSDDRLIEARRGFANQEEARQAGEGAKRLIENIANAFGMQYLVILTGQDEETTSPELPP